MKALHQWRMGWDSNPRYGSPYGGFQDRCLKPLGHPSCATRTNIVKFVEWKPGGRTPSRQVVSISALGVT